MASMKNGEFQVYIEMPAGSPAIKYESRDDHFFVKRIIDTPLVYPTNYGCIPKTLAEDGDELDALVITPHPLAHRSRIKCRALGILDVDDQEGKDHKVIAIPTTSVYTGYAHWTEHSDLHGKLRAEIEHFFMHYKAGLEDRWSHVNGWCERKFAYEVIERSFRAHKRAKKTLTTTLK